jgi:6,7-dimethyl-8-ribityllumazine synthase
MSGHGAPSINLEGAETLKVTVVAGMWHEKIAGGLLAGCLRVLDTVGCSYNVIHVPGSFELPVASQAALRAGADCVVALGVIIRGGTPHFEYVSSAATTGLTNAALAAGKPVGFGVLTVDNEEQAMDRAGFESSSEDKGAEAAEAALHTALSLRNL